MRLAIEANILMATRKLDQHRKSRLIVHTRISFQLLTWILQFFARISVKGRIVPMARTEVTVQLGLLGFSSGRLSTFPYVRSGLDQKNGEQR